MQEALAKVGSMVCRMLEFAATPIDDRYSLYVCPCTGAFAIIEFSRKRPDETPERGFRARRRRFGMLFRVAWQW